MRILTLISLVATTALISVGCGSKDDSVETHPDKNVMSRKLQGPKAGSPGGAPAGPVKTGAAPSPL